MSSIPLHTEQGWHPNQLRAAQNVADQNTATPEPDTIINRARTAKTKTFGEYWDEWHTYVNDGEETLREREVKEMIGKKSFAVISFGSGAMNAAEVNAEEAGRPKIKNLNAEIQYFDRNDAKFVGVVRDHHMIEVENEKANLLPGNIVRFNRHIDPTHDIIVPLEEVEKNGSFDVKANQRNQEVIAAALQKRGIKDPQDIERLVDSASQARETEKLLQERHDLQYSGKIGPEQQRDIDRIDEIVRRTSDDILSPTKALRLNTTTDTYNPDGPSSAQTVTPPPHLDLTKTVRHNPEGLKRKPLDKLSKAIL